VLVPLDGTPFAESALEAARTLATRSGAPLHLVGVVAGDEAKLDVGDSVEVTQPGSREFADQLEAYISDLAERLRSDCDCEVETGVLTAAHAASGLTEYSQRVDVGLTVMATSSRNMLAKAIWGEAPAEVSDKAPGPVLLLPAAADGGAGGKGATVAHGGVRSVAAVLESSGARDDIVLRHAAEVARIWDAELWLLQGMRPGAVLGAAPDPRDVSMPTNDPQSHAAVRAHLEELAEDLSHAGVRARPKALDGSEAASALLRFVAMKKIGIVVMGSHERNLIEPLLFGSVSGKTARRSARTGVLLCPVPAEIA
jgi:nucleotide-binding universal stress UspA family protein